MSTYRTTFEADDSSFTSAMRRMKQESETMATDLISDANKVAAATGQGVNKVLAESIALYERRRELMKSEERLRQDASYQSKLSGASNPAQKESINSEWIAADKRLTEQFKKDDLQIDLLREIILTLKETASMEMADDKSQAAINASRIKSGDTGGMSPQEEYKARVQASMIKDPAKTDEEGKRGVREMWETAKGTFLGQMAYGMVTQAARAVSSSITSSDGEIGASRLWSAVPVFGSILESASAKNMELAEKRDRQALFLNTRGTSIDILQDLDEQSRVASAEDKAAWSPENNKHRTSTKFNGENIFFGAKSMQDAQEIEDSKARAARSERAKIEAETKSNTAQFMDWSYNDAGVSSTDFLDIASKLLPEIGSARGLQGQTKSLIDITRGGGINEGTALSLAGILRQSGGGDLGDVMGKVVGELQSGGVSKAMRDRSVADVLSMSQSRLGEGFDGVDPIRMAKVKSAFTGNFGAGSNLASADSIMGVMSAVGKPKDDYQTGMNFQVYAAQMAREGKATSYVGFQKWQEKPEDGLMSGILDLSKQFGGGEMSTMFLKNLGIGKSWEGAEAFAGMDTSGLSPDGMSKDSKTVGFKAEATSRMQNQAKLEDAYTQGMFKGIGEALNQVASSIAKNSQVTADLLKFLKTTN